MKLSYVLLLSALFVSVHAALMASTAEGDSLTGVVKMLQRLKDTNEKDQREEAQAFRNFLNWCRTTSTQQQHAIKLDARHQAKLKARIEALESEASSSTEKLNDSANSIAASEQDEKSAVQLRQKQHEDFKAAQAELSDTMTALTRAIAIIEREMQKNPSAFVQEDKFEVTKALQALTALIDAAAFSTSDRAKLVAFMQSQQGDQDDLEATPAPPADNAQSGNILDILEDMKDKAENQLNELRKQEKETAFEHQQLLLSLRAEQATESKDMEAEKMERAAAKESQASATKDLMRTTKLLESETKDFGEAQAQCMQISSNYEAAKKSRAEETVVIAKALEILTSMVSDASKAYNFVQVQTTKRKKSESFSRQPQNEVLALVKHMARVHHSASLAQLASGISAVLHFGAGNGHDVFTKVKQLIEGLIEKLQKEQQDDATEKAYCDQQLRETANKKDDLEEQLTRLGSTIDQKSAMSAETKEDVKDLQSQLSELEQQQAEINDIRKSEHEAFLKTKKDLEEGIAGIRTATRLLRDFFGKKEGSAAAEVTQDESFFQDMRQPSPPETGTTSHASAAETIIQVLEMMESDFATTLAKEQTAESDEENAHEKLSQELQVEEASKKQEVNLKTQEFISDDKFLTQLSSDREGLTSEQAAVLEYDAKVKDRCIAQPKSYEERRKRQEAEITGLKEALELLKTDAVFMQRKRHANFLHRHNAKSHSE